jgi:hypothetical protein
MTSVILAFALAVTLASHEANIGPDWSVFGAYIYWIARIGMAYLIVIGAYAALGQIMTGRSSPLAHAGLACALAFPHFVMSVTTMDLLIGDLELLRTEPNVLLNRIGIEAASLIDNHVIISAILLAPYLLALQARNRTAVNPPPLRTQPVSTTSTEAVETPDKGAPVEDVELPGLLLACQPPVRGDILAAEAQEHYVKIKATGQGGMALYRFGDAVRELGRYQGMQVHRSHWISDEAVSAVVGKRGSLKIELTDGEVIPVSRRYELEVEARYGGRGPRAL